MKSDMKINVNTSFLYQILLYYVFKQYLQFDKCC